MMEEWNDGIMGEFECEEWKNGMME